MGCDYSLIRFSLTTIEAMVWMNDYSTCVFTFFKCILLLLPSDTSCVYTLVIAENETIFFSACSYIACIFVGFVQVCFDKPILLWVIQCLIDV